MSLLKVAKKLIWQLHNNKAFYHLERVSFTSQKSKTKSCKIYACLIHGSMPFRIGSPPHL